MPTPLEIVRQHFPWDVPAELQSPVYDLMRVHGDFMATGGRGMDASDLTRVHSFHDRLLDENAVIEFDPNIPAADGMNGAGRLRIPSAHDRRRRPPDPRQRLHGADRRGRGDLVFPARGEAVLSTELIRTVTFCPPRRQARGCIDSSPSAAVNTRYRLRHC